MKLKTLALATALVAAGTMATAGSDYFLTLTPGSMTVDSNWDTTQASGIGFSVGMSADYDVVTLTGEVGLYDAMDDTYTVSVSSAATVTAFEMNGVGVDLGGFVGLDFTNVGDFDVDRRDTIYGVQMSMGFETIDVRSRVYLGEDDTRVDMAIVLSF